VQILNASSLRFMRSTSSLSRSSLEGALVSKLVKCIEPAYRNYFWVPNLINARI